jgi:isoleucyl-tRNA synthetase
MRAVRRVVRLARSVRERLRLKHRHPLAAIAVSGVDPAVLVGYADLLGQELNVKRVDVLVDPERHVRRVLRVNAAHLGDRLRDRLPQVQQAAAAGEYTMHGDGTITVADVRLQAGEFVARAEPIDPEAAVAADGEVVVWLDVRRDDRLRLEGDARDLNRVIQDLRKQARLGYADRIVVSLAGRGLDPLIEAFGPWLREQALAVELSAGPIGGAAAVGTARLTEGPVQVAIACVGEAVR